MRGSKPSMSAPLHQRGGAASRGAAATAAAQPERTLRPASASAITRTPPGKERRERPIDAQMASPPTRGGAATSITGGLQEGCTIRFGGLVLSSDSEPAPAGPATSAEFDRLMEDSVDSEAGLPSTVGCGSNTATARALSGAFQEASALASPATHSTMETVAHSSIHPQAPYPAVLPLAPLASSPAPIVSSPVIAAAAAASNDGASESQRSLFLQLSAHLDEISSEMKRSCLQECASMMKQMNDQHKASSETQAASASSELQRKQQEVDGLLAEKQEFAMKLKRKNDQLKHVASLLQASRWTFHNRCTTERALSAWRNAAREQRLEDREAARREQLASTQVLRRVFVEWRRSTNGAARARIADLERKKAEILQATIFQQMEVERERAVSELTKLKEQLAKEERQRMLLQENLKRVFMRGVCALNFEAMNLLSDGSSGVAAAGLLAPPTAPSAPFDWSGLEAAAQGGSFTHTGAVAPLMGAAVDAGSKADDQLCDAGALTAFAAEMQLQVAPSPSEPPATCLAAERPRISSAAPPFAMEQVEQWMVSSSPPLAVSS
mmetsp:Transcript_61437/g.146483  ORF Transcript_61437/g.146483 Transcript_61437/m.146483 type:complete len:555 (+) Transcript_61437:73-1737(+)